MYLLFQVPIVRREQSAHKARVRRCPLARFLRLLEQIPRNKVHLYSASAGKQEVSIHAVPHLDSQRGKEAEGGEGGG